MLHQWGYQCRTLIYLCHRNLHHECRAKQGVFEVKQFAMATKIGELYHKIS